MDKVPISIVVITKNEEHNIASCLQTVADWAGEIVVLDDMSTDRTVEVARRFTSTVLQRQMDVEGRHRNFAYAQASQPWVLSLDADERVTPALADEIQRTCTQAQTPHTCYAIPIKTFIGQRWIKGAGYYPAPKVRLFQRGTFRYEEARVHPRAFMDGSCGRLRGDILHYSSPDLEHWIAKFNRETTLEADKWVRDGRSMTLAKSLRKSIDRFLKNYLLKGGWRDGLWGYLMSIFHGLYQLITYVKYRETVSQQHKDRAPQE